MVVLGYEIGQEIGNGAHGTVRLGYKDGEYVAIKILQKVASDGQMYDVNAAKKEFKIHSSVSHQNIIKVFGCTEDAANIFILMEYAAAGELFDKIEPDVGVGEEVAHFYFTQLMASVSYLHSLGVCHRDLKPENILLDECGNLKLSDFGLATVFMHKGVKRVLKTPCGSPPYLAPEIRQMLYEGNQVDLWSCGIILFVLLVGNTIWAEPALEDRDFYTYLQLYPSNLRNLKEWARLSPMVMELLVGILNVDPSKRYTVNHITLSSWFRTPNPLLDENGMCSDPQALAERMKSKLDITEDECAGIAYSQPTDLRLDHDSEDVLFEDMPQQSRIMSFSQPTAAHIVDDYESPIEGRQNQVTNTQLARRGLFVDIFPSAQITRFSSPYPAEDIFQRLAESFQEFLVPCKMNGAFKMTFTTVDKRKCQLHGEINIQTTSQMQLVSFKRSKGDPLEFKRLFKAVVDSVQH